MRTANVLDSSHLSYHATRAYERAAILFWLFKYKGISKELVFLKKIQKIYIELRSERNILLNVYATWGLAAPPRADECMMEAQKYEEIELQRLFYSVMNTKPIDKFLSCAFATKVYSSIDVGLYPEIDKTPRFEYSYPKRDVS